MNLAEFEFDLPNELIALRPARPRSSARLLVSPPTSPLSNHRFHDLPQILSKGDRLVINDTKVIPAHLRGVRQRAGSAGIKISVNLDRPLEKPNTWLALAKPARRIRIGDIGEFGSDLQAKFVARKNEFFVLEFCHLGDQFDALLSRAGKMPLPPYITAARPYDKKDEADYQTVFAEHTGAVAAPTASLHFDHDLMAALKNAGIQFSYITLHIGAGTFLPIRCENIHDHKMHAEFGEISADAAAEINQTLESGQRVIPVGTTALRLIETAAQDGQVQSWRGDTNLYIKPGFEFQITKGLITNFHMPNTTLLVLVAALIGTDRLKQLYRYAVCQRYRFLSYGDGSLLLP